MKLRIKNGKEYYEINLEPFTQLCGVDFRKKDFILTSLCKHFSSEKYSDYEEGYRDNLWVDGQKVGRNYFMSYRVKTREDLLGAIKLAKTSLLMKYLTVCLTDFECQKELDAIGEHLERLYLGLNQEMMLSLKNIELCYEKKELLDIVQNSEICGKEEQSLLELTNGELLETYCNLIERVQKYNSKKVLLVVDNIDHLLSYQEYCVFCRNALRMCHESAVWFIVSSSIVGYVDLTKEYFSGIHAVNSIIFSVPEKDQLEEFIYKRYPVELERSDEWLRDMQLIIHDIGREDYSLNLKSAIILKLLNDSLYIRNSVKKGVNQVENSFLIGADVI